MLGGAGLCFAHAVLSEPCHRGHAVTLTDLLGEGHPPRPGRGPGGAWALGTRGVSKPGLGGPLPGMGT